MELIWETKNATCHTPECPNVDIVCEVYVADSTPVFCGCCNQQITDVELITE